MRALVYMASGDKVDVDAFHKGIQSVLEKPGKSKFGFGRTAVSNFKSKRQVGPGNEIVDYFRAPCLATDQKTSGLWERDWPKWLKYRERVRAYVRVFWYDALLSLWLLHLDKWMGTERYLTSIKLDCEKYFAITEFNNHFTICSPRLFSYRNHSLRA